MRTTINVDAELLAKAAALAAPLDRTALIHEGLRALIERESARRHDAAARPRLDPGRHVGMGRSPAPRGPLQAALPEQGRAPTHPFIVGEIACGSLAQRGVVLRPLGNPPAARPNGIRVRSVR